MNELTFGVVSVGNIGSAHAASLFAGKIDRSRLGFLCDSDPAKKAFCAERFPGVPFFEDAEELFAARPDAVMICVPHPLHAELGIKALEAGINVICEKPLDVSVKRAKALCDAAEKNKKALAVMLNQRTDPIFRKARELFLSGAIGELKRSVWIITNWYRTQEYYDSGSWRATWNGEGGGVLLNQAPHNLDLWQWICGMPATLRADCRIGRFHDIEVEDEATLMCRWENGAEGIFITSTGDYPGTNRLEITGTKGRILLEHSRLTLETFEPDERVFRLDESKKPRETKKLEYTFEEKGSHKKIIANFAAHLLDGEKLTAPGRDGLNQLVLSNAAYLSSFSGKEVSLPPDGDEFEKLLAELQKNSAKKSASSSAPDGEYRKRWQVNW